MGRERKCNLCGGRLDNSLRCTVCGLDNNKTDDMYKHLLNQNECKNEPLTHVHEEKELSRTVQRESYDYAKYTDKIGKNRKTGKKINNVVGGIAIAVIIMIIVSYVFMTSFVFSRMKEFQEIFKIEEVYPEYLYPEEDNYECELPSGFYEIGVHIPEGNYIVSVGKDEYASVGLYELLEDDLPHRESWSFGPLQTDEYEIEFREGNYIQVATHSAIRFRSLTNYDYNEDKIVIIENQDSYHAKGRMVAGKDFPAGVYDVYFTAASGNGQGYVNLYLMNQSGTEFMWNELLYFDENAGDGYYASFPFTPGSEFIADEGLKGMLLVPSHAVGLEMYDITWGANIFE